MTCALPRVHEASDAASGGDTIYLEANLVFIKLRMAREKILRRPDDGSALLSRNWYLTKA